MRIAFIGPPGVGKSTQAKTVGRFLPFHNHSPRLSSGELVRAEIQAETEIGRQIQADNILDALGHPESARFYETSQRS